MTIPQLLQSKCTAECRKPRHVQPRHLHRDFEHLANCEPVFDCVYSQTTYNLPRIICNRDFQESSVPELDVALSPTPAAPCLHLQPRLHLCAWRGPATSEAKKPCLRAMRFPWQAQSSVLQDCWRFGHLLEHLRASVFASQFELPIAP